MTVDSKSENVVQVVSHELISIDEPKRYYIVMHNDDNTPFDFVIEVLTELYRHD